MERDTVKQAEMKGQIKKDYLRRTRKVLENKLHCRNLNNGINALDVPLVRYSEPFSKWTREELQQIDQRIRELMMMHKDLNPRDDVDRLWFDTTRGRLYKKGRMKTHYSNQKQYRKHKNRQNKKSHETKMGSKINVGIFQETHK